MILITLKLSLARFLHNLCMLRVRIRWINYSIVIIKTLQSV
nr:MAG TPA: hypothetical protein [Bacteriophage sp.]